VKCNKDFTLFVDSFSDVLNPVRTSVLDEFGRVVRAVDPGTYHATHAKYLSQVRAPEFFQVKTRDGCELEAMMILPKEMEAGKKYPVICYQYSGPATPLVKQRWGGMNYLWHQMMANKGYIIWVCDVRTASGKAGSTWTGYRKFGELEMKDTEDSVAHLSSLDFVDSQRLGIWGWSFGGYMAAYALTHSHLFKCGVAGAPVTDWTLYDSIYTERYMDTPENNPEGYEKSSVTKAAHELSGKLLLIHGTMDDNVHIQNSVQLIHELQKNNIPFEYMCYPNSRHGVDGPLIPHYRALVTDFFQRSL
jgi:dipeptidyl-peptidase-4